MAPPVYRSAGALLVALACAAPALPALGFEASLYTRHRFFAESLAGQFTRTQPRYAELGDAGREQELAYQLVIIADVEARPADWLGLRIGLDSGLVSLGKSGARLDGLSLGKRASETLLLGETYAEAQLGEAGVVQLRLGKLIAGVGDGIVFDGYALGAELDVDPSYADPEVPLFGSARVVVPDATFTARGKKSPLLGAELGYRVGEQGTVALFGALLVDGADDLAPVVRTALFSGAVGLRCQQILRRFQAAAADCSGDAFDITTSGVLGWVGARGRYRSAALDLRATAILGLGQADAKVILPTRIARATTLAIAMSSLLASAEARWRVASPLVIGGFALAATGDAGFQNLPAEETYTGFLALSPRLPLTSIFFGGGLATTLQSATLSSVAPNGSGLISGGATVELQPWGDDFTAAVSGALMTATHASATGRFYGGEIDARISAYPLEELEIFGSAAVFLPGAYYDEREAGLQVFLGAALALGH